MKVFCAVWCLGAAVVVWDRLDKASHVYMSEKKQKQICKCELLLETFNALAEVLIIFSTAEKMSLQL